MHLFLGAITWYLIVICNMPIYQLSKDLIFPPVSEAEDGIVAVGGDLRPERLILAYRSGIFPWFNEDDPIIWWSPDPRFVLFPEKLYLSKTTQRIFRNHSFTVTFNQDFEGVINHCKHVPREGQEGTWITKEMKAAYVRLHELGHAKSVEVWQEERLVGGMYGIQLGNVFSGESMFSLVSNASKIALITFIQNFAQQGGQLFDCQIHSDHMEAMGAENISRDEYLRILRPI